MPIFLKPLSIFSSSLFSYTDQNKFEHLQSALQTAFENEQAYLANPTDFLTAYHFIDTHPAFGRLLAMYLHGTGIHGGIAKIFITVHIMMKMMGN